MTWELHRHDAAHVSTLLEPESVDLIVTSPPYFALRSYQDGGEHYAGQIGSEPTPTAFLDALIACTADWLRVLKPGGSLWVNLGDKYSGGGGQWDKDERPDSRRKKFGVATPATIAASSFRTASVSDAVTTAPTDSPSSSSGRIPPKSLMGLPWRYALRCVDELGLILRAEVIWSKPNGLPESVTDRVRRSHEQWFHFTRQGRYFAAIDEVREAHVDAKYEDRPPSFNKSNTDRNDWMRQMSGGYTASPLGKAPGSVWSVPSEPLVVPDELGVDHFAAFPSEWPRRIILGWSPSGYCTACGEARRAVVDRKFHGTYNDTEAAAQRERCAMTGGTARVTLGQTDAIERTITGYACACLCQRCDSSGCIEGPEPGWYELDCPDCKGTGKNTDAPTRPAVVLDPFAGTGTTVAVAHLLDRHGIGTDLSRDYLRLAEWRCTSDTRLRDKVLDRSGLPPAPKPPAINGQLDLLGEWTA